MDKISKKRNIVESEFQNTQIFHKIHSLNITIFSFLGYYNGGIKRVCVYVGLKICSENRYRVYIHVFIAMKELL